MSIGGIREDSKGHKEFFAKASHQNPLIISL